MTATTSGYKSYKPGTRTRLQKPHQWLADLLQAAGARINGPNPWDPQIHNPATYNRILARGSVGIGESYMDGWWDCEQLDELVSRLINADVDTDLVGKWHLMRHWLIARLFNLQSEKRSHIVGEQHYDVSNDLYRAMLDPTMSYSCGYWQTAGDLNQAQADKLELICKKLKLQPGETVLDIGCGWGGFAEWAARNHGVHVTGITISREQQALARERCVGLPVEVALQDYRQLQGQFDKITSIGMFEHVGHKNYDTYLRHAHRLMKDDGIFVLHTIGNPLSRTGVDPWIHRYIFPNGELPSLAQLSSATEPYFVIEDVHNFGPDYDKTLMAWHANFEAAWPQLKQQYGERFYRMWNYYLKSCAGGFRSRALQLYQVVLRKRHHSLPRYFPVR